VLFQDILVALQITKMSERNMLMNG